MATKPTTPPAAPEAPPAAATPPVAKVNAVKVCSLSPSGTFRRIGREFPHKGVEIPLSQLTDQELEILSHEPMLSLQFVEIDAEPAAA
jgi:hypothetical protein